MAAFLVVIIVAALIFDVMIGGAWQASLRAEIERNLIQKAQLLAHRVETDRGHSLAAIAAQEGASAGPPATSVTPPTLPLALIGAPVPANWSAPRLERIVDGAARIAEGDLQARIKEASQDE